MKKNYNKQNNKKVVYLDLTDPNKTVAQAIEDLKKDLKMTDQAATEVMTEVVIKQEVTKKPWYKKIWKTIKSIF